MTVGQHLQQRGKIQQKHQMKAGHLDFTGTLAVCELLAVPTSSLYSVRLLCGCVYEVIHMLLFLSNPVIKHYRHHWPWVSLSPCPPRNSISSLSLHVPRKEPLRVRR